MRCAKFGTICTIQKNVKTSMKECYFNKFIEHVTDLLFSAYAKFSEDLTLRECAYQGVRNVRFSGKFAYVLNECPIS